MYIAFLRTLEVLLGFPISSDLSWFQEHGKRFIGELGFIIAEGIARDLKLQLPLSELKLSNYKLPDVPDVFNISIITLPKASTVLCEIEDSNDLIYHVNGAGVGSNAVTPGVKGGGVGSGARIRRSKDSGVGVEISLFTRMQSLS